METRRGAFICLEGIDHSGKTTQSEIIYKHLTKLGIKSKIIRFPDRNTPTGLILDAYLKNSIEIDDHVVHLIYSANRWEKMVELRDELLKGTTLIVDRYSYSGVAYSFAKGYDIEWCKSSDNGIINPDLVIYLQIPTELSMLRGTNKQKERYEKADFLTKVKSVYENRLRENSWKIIDASVDIDTTFLQIIPVVMDTINGVKNHEIGILKW